MDEIFRKIRHTHTRTHTCRHRMAPDEISTNPSEAILNAFFLDLILQTIFPKTSVACLFVKLVFKHVYIFQRA